MNEEQEDNNIQWKKKNKKAKKEVVGLNIDLLKSNLEEIKTKNKITSDDSSSKIKPIIKKDLKKIRKKIREVFDEDDDDEDDNVTSTPFELEMLDIQQESIISSLKQEKNSLANHKITENIIQTNNANKTILEMGLKNISKKAINNNVQNAAIGEDVTKKIIQEEIKKQTNIKTDNLTEKQFEELTKEIKEDKTDKELAVIILEKTGRSNTTGKRKAKQSKIKQNIKQISREK